MCIGVSICCSFFWKICLRSSRFSCPLRSLFGRIPISLFGRIPISLFMRIPISLFGRIPISLFGRILFSLFGRIPISLFGRICRSAPDRVTLGLSKNPPAWSISIFNALFGFAILILGPLGFLCMPSDKSR